MAYNMSTFGSFVFVNMADFVPKKEHLREVMLHYFLMKKLAAETARILGGVYGDNAPPEKICQRWFGRFRRPHGRIGPERRQCCATGGTKKVCSIMSC